MPTDYNGGPVEGGTYPAVIWRDFMIEALQIVANEAAGRQEHDHDRPPGSPPAPAPPSPARHEHDRLHGHARRTPRRPETPPRPALSRRRRPQTGLRPPAPRPHDHGDTTHRPTRAATVQATTRAAGPRRRRARHQRRLRTLSACAPARDRYRLPAQTEPPRQLDGAGDPDPAVPLDLRIAAALGTRARSRSARAPGRCRCRPARSRAPG